MSDKARFQDVVTIEVPQCSATYRGGVRCKLPQGHTCDHEWQPTHRAGNVVARWVGGERVTVWKTSIS